jgi:hypothetical protein
MGWRRPAGAGSRDSDLQLPADCLARSWCTSGRCRTRSDSGPSLPLEGEARPPGVVQVRQRCRPGSECGSSCCGSRRSVSGELDQRVAMCRADRADLSGDWRCMASGDESVVAGHRNHASFVQDPIGCAHTDRLASGWAAIDRSWLSSPSRWSTTEAAHTRVPSQRTRRWRRMPREMRGSVGRRLSATWAGTSAGSSSFEVGLDIDAGSIPHADGISCSDRLERLHEGGR